MKLDLTKGTVRNGEFLSASSEMCEICINSEGGGVSFPEIKDCDARYVIGDVEVLEEDSAAMMFRFFTAESAEKERIYMRFGLLPKYKTRICLDLTLLDNRTIFTNRTPGTLKLVVHGQRTEREDVVSFELGTDENHQPIHLRLENFYMSDETPEYPMPDVKLVDEFGQWKPKEWPGKVKSFEELVEVMKSGEGEAAYPFPNWDIYGGDTTRHLKEGTGFFSTIKTEDGRWHLVDPLGNDYFSVGPCITRPGDFGRVDYWDNVMDWLPEDDDPVYGECLQSGTRQRAAYMPPETFRMANYTMLNLKRVYGENWKEKWEEITHHVLMSNGINSQGNFPGLCVNDGRGKIPYVREITGFPVTDTLIFRDFPDVLSDQYRERCEAYAQTLEGWKDDPLLIGYFLRNEPEFNFVENIAMADEVLHNPADTCCKEGLINFLKERYQTIEAMNAVWGSAFTSFEDLKQPIDKCSADYPGSEKDIREYSVFLIREYIRIPSEACRAIDKNHLNLGLRWSKAYNADMMAGWEYFDVFSINCYDFDPTKDMNFAKNAGVDLPILIGEFHSGALDRGLPATGLKGVKNQEERGVMWRYFVEKVAAHPYGIGAHWFQLSDQFCLGRFDGENYQIGVFDVCMRPYPELMDAAKATSEVLYEVKNGERESYDRVPEKIPMIGY